MSPSLAKTLVIDNIPSEARTQFYRLLTVQPREALLWTIGDAATDLAVDPLALRAQDLIVSTGRFYGSTPTAVPPADNPFYEPATPASVRSKVWAYGLRNPSGLRCIPPVGRPYIGIWDGIPGKNSSGRGVNFGWPCLRGRTRDWSIKVFAECQGWRSQRRRQGVMCMITRWEIRSLRGVSTPGCSIRPSIGELLCGGLRRWMIERLYFDTTKNLISINLFAVNLTSPVALEMGPEGFLYYVALVFW